MKQTEGPNSWMYMIMTYQIQQTYKISLISNVVMTADVLR